MVTFSYTCFGDMYVIMRLSTWNAYQPHGTCLKYMKSNKLLKTQLRCLRFTSIISSRNNNNWWKQIDLLVDPNIEIQCELTILISPIIVFQPTIITISGDALGTIDCTPESPFFALLRIPSPCKAFGVLTFTPWLTQNHYVFKASVLEIYMTQKVNQIKKRRKKYVTWSLLTKVDAHSNYG